MRTTQVLRLEDRNGRGPFSGRGLMYDFDAIAEDEGIKPRSPNAQGHGGAYHMMFRGPGQEPNIRNAEWRSHKFAFRDKAQGRRWFTPAMLRLIERHGLHLTTYEVPDERPALLKGRDQVAFNRRAATAIRRESPLALWED